jgi:TonB-dependent starch-binding outer membrane protein SusC
MNMKRILILMGMLLFMGTSLFGQQIRVTGTVTDAADGATLPGVTVMVQGTTIGVITDVNGRYEVTVNPNATLVFSFIGLRTTQIPVEGRTVINVALERDVVAIDEFVVVGYGVQRKREVTGSITSVSGDDLAQVASPSFDSQLAGRAAGVQVTSTSGVLGEAPRIRIRGVGSITSGTYPLIVVDGIPILTGDIGGYANTNALGDINPADIESVEVLKDGSATAIYGSRAANGVILITTKRGTAGKFQVTYNNYFGIAQPVRLFDLTNESEFIQLAGEMFANAGNPTNPAVAAGLDTDWQLAVLRDNAFQQDHNVSMSGATDETSYYFSMGYSDQEGVTRPNDMNRFTFRSNVDQRVSNAIRIGASANLARTAYNGQNTGENSLSGNIFSAIRQLPNTPVYNPDHPTGYNIDLVNNQLVGRWNNLRTIDDNLPNIRYTLDENIYGSKVNRGTMSTYGMVNILPSLNFRTQLGVDMSMTEGHLYWNPMHGDGASVNGRIYNTQTNYNRWNVQNILSYVETFGNLHNLNLTLVSEVQKQRYNYFFSGGTDMSDTFFRHGVIGGSYATQLSSGSMTENGIISYAGRLNYNFDGKYFFSATARYDGLSSLPQANKWGFFPGGSVGWTVSREDFMQNVDWLSNLMLRFSYAEVGNSSIGNYPYLGLYGGVRYADYTGIAFIQMGNDQLRWETSKKWDAGLDASLFDGKYNFTYDYFMNDQDGLILDAPTPPSFGVPGNSVSKNIGSLQNWGHEFALEANFIRTRDLSWTVDFNLTLSKNEVTSLVDDQPIIGAYTLIDVGESIRSVYGYDYVGVNAANGNPIYRKADGSMVQGNIATQNYRVYDPNNPTDISVASTLSNSDKIVFGPSMPTFYGAVNSRLRYKNFDFSAMFRYAGGNYVMNRTRQDLVSNSFTNYGRELLGRWQSPENPGDGWTPKLWHGRTNFINEQGTTTGRFVEKGDFIKLQNLVLGYTLPQELLGRLGVDRLRVFVSGSDLFMITDYTGIDPEMERGAGIDWNGTPRQRTLTFGLNLSI